MAEIRKIQEGMTGAEVADLLDGNFRGLDSDIQKNAVAVNTLNGVLQGVQKTLGTATTDISELELWASETVPGTYATKEALKGYLALVGDAQTVRGTVYFYGAYFNNVPFADVGSKSVRMATMDDVPGFTPLLDEGVEIARVDIGGQQVFLYAPSVDLTNYYTKTEIAKVATSGSYNDLIDKPAIPSVVDSLVSDAVADALSAKQGKVLNDAVGALRAALSLVESSYLDKTNPTVTGNMTVSGLLSAGSLSVGGRAIGMAAFYGVGNTVASGNYELITGGGVYTALQGYATTGALAGYLPTIGGTLTGALRVESMLTVTGVSEIAMLSCPKGLVVGDDQESGQAFKSFTNMFGWNGDGADLTEDWTWMIGKDGRATFGVLNAASLTMTDGSNEYAGVYYDDSWGVYLWNEAANAGLGLTDDGIPHVNGLSLLYVGNYDLYLDRVYAKKATTLAGYGITDNVFVPRIHITSGENADNLIANGIYLNASGNGSGNSNFPQLYSVFLNFFQSDSYRAQLSVGTSLWFRRKIDSWEPWRECLDSTNFSNYALPLSGGIMDRNTGITWNNGYYDSDAVGSHLSVLADTTQGNSLATQTGYSYNAILNVGGGGIDSYRFQLASYANSDNFLFYRGYDANSNKWKNWEQIIHSGNIANYALSKTGGQIYNPSHNAEIDLKSSGNNTDSWLYFTDAVTTDIYGIGIRRPVDLYGFQYREKDKFYKILHTGNLSDYALPKIGGEITGSLGVTGNISAQGNITTSNGSFVGNWSGHRLTFYNNAYLQSANVHLQSTALGNSWNVFDSSDNTLFRVKDNGNVLIGTTEDRGHKLDVNGTTAAEGFILKPSYIGSRIGGVGLDGGTKNVYLFTDLGADDIYLFANGDGNKNITLKGSTGNVLIGTTTDSGQKLQVNGNSCVNGSLTVSGGILPSTTDTQSLGSTSSYWKNLYVGIITGHYQRGDVVKFSGSINANEGNISCKRLIVNGVTITGDYATKTDLDSYLPKSGGAVTGTLSIGSTRLNVGSTTLHGDVSLEYGALTLTHGNIGSSYWSITNDGEATVRTLSQTSDITKKNVISDIRLSLGTMANAPLIKFTWADGLDSRLHVGTIAQYWDACLPEVVSTTTNGTLALAYGELGVAMGISLAKEVQELTEEVQRLRDENRALAQRLNNAGVA